MNVRESGKVSPKLLHFEVLGQGGLKKLDNPVVSLSARLASKLLNVLTSDFFLRNSYPSYSFRPVNVDREEVGMQIVYHQVSPSVSGANLSSRFKFGELRSVHPFIRNYILPNLPAELYGPTVRYVTPEYLGDPGVGYADARPEVRLAKEEVIARLQKDISSPSTRQAAFQSFADHFRMVFEPKS